MHVQQSKFGFPTQSKVQDPFFQKLKKETETPHYKQEVVYQKQEPNFNPQMHRNRHNVEIPPAID